MINTQNGVQFSDEFELNYHLFMEIGLSVNYNGYLYDQDTGIEIKYKDKYIKSSTVPMPLYAGRNDIIFEPAKNYNLMTTLLGYYIDKETNSDDGDRIGYIAQYIDDNPTKDKQRIVIKTKRGDIASKFYYNVYLGYIECIFMLGGSLVPDLSNFDIQYQE